MECFCLNFLHLQQRRQPLGWPEVIQVRLRQHVSQAGGRSADKAGVIRNKGRRGDFASESIDQLDQEDVSCLPQDNSFCRICLVDWNNGYRKVDGQLDISWHDKFVQMEPAGYVHQATLRRHDRSILPCFS